VAASAPIFDFLSFDDVWCKLHFPSLLILRLLLIAIYIPGVANKIAESAAQLHGLLLAKLVEIGCAPAQLEKLNLVYFTAAQMR